MWKLFLSFPPPQRRAIVYLLGLFVVFAVVSELFIFAERNKQPDSYDQLRLQIDSFAASLQPRDGAYYENRLNRYIVQRYDTLSLFGFNPNKASKNELTKLGLSEKQAGNIVTYRTRGGKFVIKDDFKKIYGIRPLQFQYLKPYIELPNERPKRKQTAYGNKKNYEGTLRMFDPNTADKPDLLSLGFSEKQAGMLIKYREKGAVFSVKADFKKLYFVDDALFGKYEPFIMLPDTVTAKTKPIADEKLSITVLLNTADTTDFMELNGIGAYYARKIVAYRENLGGFSRIEQLLEIHRFKQSTYDKIKTQLVLDTVQIRKLNINFTNATELAKHPYIDYGTARLILDFKSKNGMYGSVADLRTKKVLTKTMYNKLVPYLSTE